MGEVRVVSRRLFSAGTVRLAYAVTSVLRASAAWQTEHMIIGIHDRLSRRLVDTLYVPFFTLPIAVSRFSEWCHGRWVPFDESALFYAAPSVIYLYRRLRRQTLGRLASRWAQQAGLQPTAFEYQVNAVNRVNIALQIVHQQMANQDGNGPPEAARPDPFAHPPAAQMPQQPAQPPEGAVNGRQPGERLNVQGVEVGAMYNELSSTFLSLAHAYTFPVLARGLGAGMAYFLPTKYLTKPNRYAGISSILQCTWGRALVASCVLRVTLDIWWLASLYEIKGAKRYQKVIDYVTPSGRSNGSGTAAT